MKDIVKLLEKTLVGGYNDITVYNLKININNKPCIITAEKHNYDMQITSYKWEITEENKDITPEIKNIILFNLIEQEENSDFKRYVNIYKDDLAETRNWIKKYSDKSDINITLEDVGNIYSKKLANIMFESGYSTCHFEDVGSLESMKAQMIHIVNQNAIMKQEDKDKINDEIFNIIDVEKGLIYKLEPEKDKERKLENVRKLWDCVIDINGVGFKDIYSERHIEKKYEIDHFIPWSYVANDELWNLIPMDGNLNSSKNNKLPDWDAYYKKFCDNQYILNETIQTNEKAREKFEKCKQHNLNSIWPLEELYIQKIEKERFFNVLYGRLHPIYESAMTQGYDIWKNCLI